MYLAIKNHFIGDYDFFKYKGRLNNKSCTYGNLLKKTYHGAIKKLSYLYTAKELRDYFVSNMLINEGSYIFDVDAEGKRIYSDYVRRKESRTYIFKQDVNRVCMELEKLKKDDFWCSTEVEDGQHPLLFRMFVGSYLAPETMCILNTIHNYIDEWDKTIDDSLFYPVVSKQIKQLSPFIMLKDYEPFTLHVETATNSLLK